jgi:hypothetical protein
MILQTLNISFLPASQDAGNRITRGPVIVLAMLPFVKYNEIIFGSPIFGATWHPDLGDDMGAQFRTPI